MQIGGRPTRRLRSVQTLPPGGFLFDSELVPHREQTKVQGHRLFQSGAPRTDRLRDGRASMSKNMVMAGRQDHATRFSF